MLLTGKTAIVTGAAQGIGLATARVLAAKGAQVGLFDMDEEKVQKSAAELIREGYKVIAGPVNVTNLDSVKFMLSSAASQFGYLDIVVNNAGILTSTPVPAITEAEWDKVLAVNLKGTFFVCQQALPYLKDRPQPRIINMASIGGRMGGFENSVAYAASKGGVISLTYGLSRQYAPFKITVNCICPGPTETPMTRQWTAEQLDGLIRRIPLGKLVKPAQIGSAVAFLASDEAEYITGVALDINGGMYVG